MINADSIAREKGREREQALFAMTLERDEWKAKYEALLAEASGAEASQRSSERAELQRKLGCQHIELARRARRDAELAYHLPVIAARLQVLAAESGMGPAPKSWEDDPEIDWTGIQR